MSTRRSRTVIRILACTLIPVLFAAADEMLLIPRMETQGGYESQDATGGDVGIRAPFMTIVPGLELTLFGRESEWTLSTEYRRTDYAEEQPRVQTETSLSAEWLSFCSPLQPSILCRGGIYRDDQQPEEASRFFLVRPTVVRTCSSLPVDLQLQGSFRQTAYDLPATSSIPDTIDQYVDLRPEIRWYVSSRTLFHVAVYAEHDREEGADTGYTGLGGSLGLDAHPMPRIRLTAWGGMGIRSHERTDDNSEWQDTLFKAGTQCSYRYAPWMDMLAMADVDSTRSTIDEEEGTSWRVAVGIQLVGEYRLDE